MENKNTTNEKTGILMSKDTVMQIVDAFAVATAELIAQQTLFYEMKKRDDMPAAIRNKMTDTIVTSFAANNCIGVAVRDLGASTGLFNEVRKRFSDFIIEVNKFSEGEESEQAETMLYKAFHLTDDDRKRAEEHLAKKSSSSAVKMSVKVTPNTKFNS